MTTTGTGSPKLASLLELEPRLMFDGAAVATAVEAAAEADTRPTAEDPKAQEPAQNEGSTSDSRSVADAILALGVPAADQETPRQVVIIDGGVSDKDGILDAIPSGADVYVLPTDADGVAMIATILAQYDDLDAVHVVSHGQDGGVMLGTATLDADSAASHAEALGRWGAALADSGDILLYGCATGSGAEGLAFLQTLAEATGADVAASEDSTGAAARGGDWDLERSAGTIEADAIEATDFSGLLVTTPGNGRSDFGTRYNLETFTNGFSGHFESTNINDLGWIASITPVAGKNGYLAVDDGGTLMFGGLETSFGANDGEVGATSLRTASGANIDILQLTIDANVTGTITIKGFRDGVVVSGYERTVSVTREPGDTPVVTLAWKNVDELRFSIPESAPTNRTSLSISEIVTGPVPTLSGSLPGSANTLVEGADGALALGDLAFSHGGVATTNLTISANGGLLSAASSGSVTVTGSGTGALTLTGSAADIDAWLNGSTNITYNSEVLHGPNALELSFSTDYEGVVLDLGTKTVDVAEVAQPARFTTLPDSFAGRVNVAKPLDFSTADLFDRDSDSVDFALTLSVDSGTLDVNGTSTGVTVSGQGTGTLVVSGKPTDVETWLNTATRITHTGTTEGTATLALSGTDSDTGPYAIGTVDINVAPANTAPTITGIPTTITLVEDIAGALDLSAIAIADADSPGIFTINIDAHLMRIGATSADGVTATVTGNRWLELTGTAAALTAYLGDASRLSLSTSADVNGTAYTTMVMTVDDGDDNIVTFNIQVDITPVEDPSTLTGSAGPFTVVEDSELGDNTLNLSDLVFIDTDAGEQTLILSVEHGILWVYAAPGLTIENNNTNKVTVTGTSVRLNGNFLDRSQYGGFRYQPDANLSGPAADLLTVSIPDGSGGETALTNIAINVTGVNDAPTLTNLPASVTVTENQLGPIDLSGAVLEDVDSFGSNFQLTIFTKSTGGFLFATSADGVTVSGSGTRTMVLTGTVADIAAFLALSDRITYQSAPNAFGGTTDRIQFRADDGDGGTFGTVPTITVNATDGPNIPTLSGTLTTVSATEDTQKVIDLSVLTLTNGGAAPTATMELEIWVGRGTLATTADARVTGTGTGALTITGTFTELTAWLASATAVTYDPEHNLAGTKADALTIRISDGAAATDATIWSVPINISSVNDKPVPSGFPTTVTTATNAPVTLDLSELRFNDPDSDTVNATLTVTGGTLTTTSAASGFAVSGAGTATLTLLGPMASVEAYLNSGGVTYTPPADSHGDGVATVSLTVDDGTGAVSAGSATINVVPPNAAPTLTDLPASVTGDEDATFAVDLSGATLADADSPDGNFVLTLAVDAGILAATSAGGVTVAGSGSGTLTLTGTVTAIGTFLGNGSAVKYTGVANAYGTAAATLTLTADDGDGNSGVALGTVQIDLTEVNDLPGIDSLPTTVTATEDVQSGLDLTGVLLSTIDPLDADHIVSFAADKGTLYGTASGGVIVAGSGTATLTLWGTRDAIQAWLAVNGNASYLGPENLAGTGAATITVRSNDLDHDDYASGEVTHGTIAIDITPVNDAPTGSGLPAAVTGIEGQVKVIDLSGLTMADIDSSDADFTLTLSADYGTLAATTGHGVTVSGSGGAALTLTGTVADIDAFLDRADAISLATVQGHIGSGLGTLTVSINDQDGSGAVTVGTVTIDVRPPNDDPTATGLPASVTATEDTASAIDLSGLTLSDPDSPDSDFVLTLAVDAGTLSAVSGGGVTIGGSGSGTLTLTGSVTAINAFLDGANAVKYTGVANAFGTGAATLTVTANDQDGSGDVSLGTVRVDVTAVNDAPTASGLPARLTVTEDVPTAINLSGLVLADVDPADDDYTLVLSVTSGSLSAASAGGVTVSGANTGTLTLSGSMTAVQAWLGTSGRVTYTGAADANGTGAATLSITGNDQDGSGTVAFGTVAIDIAAVNDAPTASGLPTSVTATEDTASAIDLSGLTLADPDSPDADFVLTLAVDAGALSAVSGGGVTIGGSGSGTLTLTGSVTAINAFLDGANAVKYTGVANAFGTGAATLTVTANDQDGSGDVSLGTVRVDVTAVNDAPTASGLPARLTVTEDVPTAINLSGLVLADVDPADDDYTLVLSVTSGSLSAASAGGVTVSGANTGTLTLSGSMAAVQAWLGTSGRVTYTGAANANGTGAATLSITGNDQDGSGAVAFGTVAIDITAVNDAPRFGDLPETVTAYRTETETLDFGGVRLTDADGQSNAVTVALSADVGRFSAISAHGVIVAGSDSGTLLLMGTAAAIEAFLRESRVSFNPGSTGAEARLTMSASDAHGGTTTATMTIEVEDRTAPFQPPPRSGSDSPAPSQSVAPPPPPLAPPESGDTPVSLAIQGALAGGGTGEVTSAILGRLGSVSGIETSGTPVGQTVRVQSEARPGGSAGGLGSPRAAERTGGILGGGFGGLGTLGRTDGLNGAGGLGDFDAPDFEMPDFEASGLDGQTRDAEGTDPTAENTARDGHRGLRWQMAAASSADREPVAALTQALEFLAGSRGA